MNIVEEALRVAEEVALPIFEREVKSDNRCRVALKKFKETGEQDSSVAWAINQSSWMQWRKVTQTKTI
jgi:hypothetical protein